MKWKGQSVHSLTSTLTSAASLAPPSSPEFIIFFCPRWAEARFCLHRCLTHLSSRLRSPPPSPTHTRSSSITHPRGNDSMKQTRTNLASASALWLCDVTGKKLFKCARLRACVWQRENDREGEYVWVSEGLHVYGICRVGRIKEGKERNKCHVSLFSWGDQLFNLQDWVNWGGEKWGRNVNHWQLFVSSPTLPLSMHHSWSPKAIYLTVWTTNDHIMPLFSRLCIWDKLTECIWSHTVCSYVCACIFHGFFNFLPFIFFNLFNHLCFSALLQKTFVK